MNNNYITCPFHGNKMPRGLRMKYGTPFFDHCDGSCSEWKQEDYCFCGEYKETVHKPSSEYKVCINRKWWKFWHESTKKVKSSPEITHEPHRSRK